MQHELQRPYLRLFLYFMFEYVSPKLTFLNYVIMFYLFNFLNLFIFLFICLFIYKDASLVSYIVKVEDLQDDKPK